jgi:DNA-directed RNA polymerase alpha subunit
MTAQNKSKQKKTCKKGHTFYKSSDCPTCPVCEKERGPATGFLALLSSPARNALLHHGIDTLEKLSAYTEKEILKLHGIGKASLPTLNASLKEQGLTFKSEAK